jgi:hypothetical protein
VQQGLMSFEHTNFTLATLGTSEQHTAVAEGSQASPAKVGSSEPLARLHGLHGQVRPHRFWDRVNVLASLEALLGQELDLGTPILEPDLNRSLGHVNFLSNPVPNGGCGCWVLVEFKFEGRELVLSGTLSLLVLLLLRQRALAGGSPGR